MWISVGHPQECVARSKSLLRTPSPKYVVTAQRLIAHCVEAHGEGFWILKEMCCHYFPHETEKVGLATAVQTNQTELVEEILAQWRSLNGQPGAAHAVSLVARYIDEPHFQRLWKAAWGDGLAGENARIGGVVFNASAFHTTRCMYALSLVKSSLGSLSLLIMDDLVFSLIWSSEMRPVRDKALSDLLAAYGSRAAKIIIGQSQYAKELPSCLAEATRILLAAEPEDAAVPIGVGLSLQSAPDFAIPIIVDWVNTGKSNHHYDQFFRWRVDQADQRSLFRALALDAIKRDPSWHHILAQVHQGLITRLEPVVEWLNDTLGDKQASRYNASLVVAYLSETRKTATPQIDKLLEFGHKIHEKYGLRNRKTILMEASLTDPKLANYEELVAIALARDVELPSRILDGEKVLRNIKQLKFTYKALGGQQLDMMIASGDLPPYAEYYEIDAEAELKSLRRRFDSGEIDLETFRWATSLPERALDFRRRWETRFARIMNSGISPPARKLRENINVWSEMRLLARLVGFFEVQYEPLGVPGMGSHQPEFVLKSPHGDLILEVATIGSKPDDLREAAKMSTGGTAKKTLQNKLHEQFNGCEGDFTLPIVIAVQTKWNSDVFDFLNSLYGPVGYSFSMAKEQGQLVEEGTTRNAHKAFFNQPDVSCISAVMRIEPNDSETGFLSGAMYRPIQDPSNPLNRRLWLRLRDAVFGPCPRTLVEQMAVIPGISVDEAELLVKHGVDDISFFAAGIIDLPDDLPMAKTRFVQLRNQAERLALISKTGQIAYLNSAKGVDLTPLYDKGVYTVSQLLERNQKPQGVTEEIWALLKEEAVRLKKGNSL